jgi:type II secretory pathway component HofQ
MSDALLERIAKATEGLLALHTKGGGGAVAPKPAAAPAAAKPAATPAKPAAAPAAKPAAKPAAAAPAAAKAPNGKHDSVQVRDAIRKVATNPNLGKQSALDILDQDGGGVTNVTNLKPEFFDAVFEACQALLAGEGEGAPADDNDLM